MIDEWFMTMFLYVCAKKGYKFKIVDGYISVRSKDFEESEE